VGILVFLGTLLHTPVEANPIIAPEIAKSSVAFSIKALKSNPKEIKTLPSTGLFTLLNAVSLAARGKTAIVLENELTIQSISPTLFYEQSTLFYETLRTLHSPAMSSKTQLWVNAALHPRNEWVIQAKKFTNLDLIISTSPELSMSLPPKPHIAGFADIAIQFQPAIRFEQDPRPQYRSYRQVNATFLTVKGNGFTAVAVPFQDQRLMAYFFLPDKSLTAFFTSLSAKSWERWMILMKPKQITLSLPNFSVTESGLFLHSEDNNLVGISHEARTMTFAYRSQLSWDPNIPLSLQPPSTKGPRITFNRPFFFVIQDLRTGAWLLSGTLTGGTQLEK
jgi:hypothetical protein